MDDIKSVNGALTPNSTPKKIHLGEPCDPVHRRERFSDMRQMVKIVARSADNYLTQPQLFTNNNIDPEIKGKLQELRANAEDLHSLIGQRSL